MCSFDLVVLCWSIFGSSPILTKTTTSWWFQLLKKICSSKWGSSSPNSRGELPPPSMASIFTDPWLVDFYGIHGREIYQVTCIYHQPGLGHQPSGRKTITSTGPSMPRKNCCKSSKVMVPEPKVLGDPRPEYGWAGWAQKKRFLSASRSEVKASCPPLKAIDRFKGSWEHYWIP